MAARCQFELRPEARIRGKCFEISLSWHRQWPGLRFAAKQVAAESISHSERVAALFPHSKVTLEVGAPHAIGSVVRAMLGSVKFTASHPLPAPD